MVRMLSSRLPLEGVVVMAEVIQIGPNRPRVKLLEYDDNVAKLQIDPIDGLARRILPLAIGRIEPMVVLRRQTIESGKTRSLIVTRGVTADDMVRCERNFVSRMFVKTVLSICASKTGKDLESIYIQLAWPDSLEALKFRLSTLQPLFPPHLRHCLRTTLRVMSFSSWRLVDPFLLAPTWKYPNGWCWAVALIRQFEHLLKSNGLLPPHEFLSVQSLFLQTPTRYLYHDGDIDDLIHARHGLLTGVTTESFCPLGSQEILPDAPYFRLESFIVHSVSDFHGAIWDRMLDERLSVGPFAASVVWFESYKNMNAADHIYKPTEQEQKVHAKKPCSSRFDRHTMLLTGSYIDENGTAILEFQDTTAGEINNGDRGYLRFARYPCSVRDMVSMTLLAPTEYPPV